MNPAFEKINKSMVAELTHCKNKKPDFRTEIECCFQISQNCFSDLEHAMESYHFKSPSEEIEFYKELKPKFIASIQYYNLLYHAELFKPAEGSVVKEFWIKEGLRMNRFILDHQVFYDYYKSGATGMDEKFFLSVAENSKGEKQMYYDEWMGQLLAFERYNEYVTVQLAGL